MIEQHTEKLDELIANVVQEYSKIHRLEINMNSDIEIGYIKVQIKPS